MLAVLEESIGDDRAYIEARKRFAHEEVAIEVELSEINDEEESEFADWRSLLPPSAAGSRSDSKGDRGWARTGRSSTDS